MDEDHQQPELSHTMSALFLSNKYSDMIIRCEGRDFPAHKAIVCPQSEVLTKEVTGVFKESNGIIEHTEYDASTVEHMMSFLYNKDYEIPIPQKKTENLDTETFTSGLAETTETPSLITETEENGVAVTSPKVSNPVPLTPSVNDILSEHVKVHHIASYYHIKPLQIKAASYFQEILQDQDWHQEGWVSLLEEIYDKPKSEDHGLRLSTVKSSALHLQEVLADTGLIDNGKLAEFQHDLLCHVAQRIETMIVESVEQKLEAAVALNAAKEQSRLLQDLLGDANGEAARANAREQAARDDISHITGLFDKLGGCYRCKESIDVSLERSGKAGKGKFFVRCGGCKAKHF